MTVGELKDILADFPDDLVVLEGATKLEINYVDEDVDAIVLWT